jgi:hypothetical protein
MSLAQSLRTLRGQKSQTAVAVACKLALRTVQRAEYGEEITLVSLKVLADYYNVTKATYAQLLLGWLKTVLRDDFELFTIKSRVGDGTDMTMDDATKLVQLYRSISPKYQRELLRAAQREQVLRSIVPLNQFYDEMVQDKQREAAAIKSQRKKPQQTKPK